MPAPNPPTLWSVPYLRNLFFTGRDDVLAQLHYALQAGATVALSHPQGISGLGGMGKTQTALEYVYRYREEYQAIFWVRADSLSSLVTDFVGIADLLQLPERTLQDQRLIAEAVQRWFHLHSAWLLIFDNAEDLLSLNVLLPKSGRGHILFTTRAQSLGGIAQRIEIEPMQPEIGSLFLLRRAGLLALGAPLNVALEDDQAIAITIVAEVAGLPLALDQAGAYIRATACTLSAYLEMYQERNTTLLQERSADSDYPESVATTWSLSFEKVTQASPIAVELLHLLAFLSPDAIPEEVIAEGSVHMGQLLEPIAHDELQLDMVISEILKYSLILRNPETSTFTIHRLVQVVFKVGMTKDMQHLWAIRAVQAMSDTFPNVDFSTWALCQRYLLHAQTSATLIQEWNMDFANAARLLNQTAVYLRTRAQYAEAEPLYIQALNIWKQKFGPLHSHVASAINNLAYLYKEWGKYEPVEQLYQLAQAIWEQTDGPDHLHVATCLINLADLYRTQGKFETVEPLYQRALVIRQQKLGLHHPDTASILHNIADCYLDQNKYEQAEPLYEQAFEIRRQTRGLEHPDTVNSLNGLARLSMQRGHYDQAASLTQQALSIQEQLLGLHHPTTATLLHNLASLYNEQGKYQQVESLYLQALAVREEKLGSWHPMVADTLNNLAIFYDEQGRYEEAEPYHQRAYTIYQQAFGEQHQKSAASLNNLAEVYRSQGKAEQAETLYTQAYAINEQILGQEHVDTTAILNNLALLYRKQGKFAQAEPLFTQIVSIRERTLGASHPRTAVSMHNLADLYRDQGKFEQAEKLYKQALEIWTQTVEPDHIMIANVCNNLALLYVQQGRHEQAKELYQQAFSIMRLAENSKRPALTILLNNYLTLLEKTGQKNDELLAYLQRHIELLNTTDKG